MASLLSLPGEFAAFSDSASAALNCWVMSSCFFCFAAQRRHKAKGLSATLLKLHLDPSALSPTQRSLILEGTKNGINCANRVKRGYTEKRVSILVTKVTSKEFNHVRFVFFLFFLLKLL